MSFPGNIPDWISKLIDRPPRQLFGLAVIGLLILALSESVMEFFGLQNFRASYKPFIGLATFVMLVWGFVQSWPILQRKIEGHKYMQLVIKRLDSLGKDELFLLLYCLENNTQTVYLELAHAAAKS